VKHLVFCLSFAAYLAFLVMLINAKLGDVFGTVIQFARLLAK